MTRDTLALQINDWAAAVRDEALRLYESGVAHGECLQLAISIVAARERKKLADRGRFAALPPRFRPPVN